MSQPSIQQVIRALGEDGRAGALGLAQHAVEMFLAGAPTPADRSLALDILVRDLATVRGVAPYLARFVDAVEAHAVALPVPPPQSPAQPLAEAA